MNRAISLVLCLTGLAACGDDATRGQGGDGAAEVLVPADTNDSTDSLDSSGPDRDALDGPVETVTDTIIADTVSDVADTTVATDASVAPETTDTADTLDSGAPETIADTVPEGIDPAACPMPSMKDDYPGPFPPFPYGTWTHAEGCIANPHDVIIVLGCPSESDGSPSKCQIDRARITEQLYEAHWATQFIVTGAAVHNGHVEADALYALLVERGLPAASIIKEPRARHTDENLYYSTRIMQEHGWSSALVVSEDPGHLMMTALCDSNCCVDLGRLSLYEWEVQPDLYVKAGHYALIPPGTPNTDAECTHISGMFMCINLGDRDACKDDFQLPPP